MEIWRRTNALAAIVLACAAWAGLRFPTFSTSNAYTPSGITTRDRETFAAHTVKENTLLFVPVNNGMLQLARNLLCSLSRTSFNTSDLIFWTLDEEAERKLSAEGHATYRDPTLYSVSDDQNQQGITAAYRRMMKERPKFFINILSSGYDILMLDADTVFWQSPLILIPDSNDSVDAIYSTDARAFYQSKDAFRDPWRRGSIIPPICNGIFWMRSNGETISLWSDMLTIFAASLPLGWYKRINFNDDQRGMDTLLNDGRAQLAEPFPKGIVHNMSSRKEPRNPRLSIRLLDQTAVVNGHLLLTQSDLYEENVNRLQAMKKDRIAAHFNWDTKVVGKEKGARENGMWFLDDDGNCPGHQRWLES